MIALALLSVASTAPSMVEPVPSDSSAIVVEGARNRERQIDNFVKELTPVPIHGQLSRFEDAVCPQVFGMPAAYNQLVAERMRAVAAAAGIPVGKASCRTNIVVVLTEDKADFIKRAALKRSYIFPQAWSGSQIRALERDPAPAVAWTIEEEISSDGKGFDYHGESAINRTVGFASRLRPPARPRSLASVLVIQADALDGLSTRQLADYAAMRTFVHTDPALIKGSSTQTILTLLDTPMGQPVPLTVTTWDLSFLKSFYSSHLNSFAEYQRSEMARSMRRDLDKQQSATR
jgi:hypothetical protein